MPHGRAALTPHCGWRRSGVFRYAVAVEPNPPKHILGLDETADLALVEAARPYLVNAAGYFEWQLDASKPDGVVGGTAGLACRIRDRALAPLGLRSDVAKGTEQMAVDLLLFCLCDALSRKTGSSFEFTTMIAFAPSPSLLKESESVDAAIEECGLRHNVAMTLFNAIQSQPDIHACFAAIGTASHRFLVRPDQSHIDAVRGGFEMLLERLKLRFSALKAEALASRSKPQATGNASARPGETGAGCLGVLLLTAAIPMACVATVHVLTKVV